MDARAYVAEFVGTFTLIFVGVGAIAADNLTGGNSSGLIGIALAHGLAIAVMVAATAAVSGGHLNPAVTVGALVTGKISPTNAAAYVVAQCLGAIVAAAAIKAAMPETALEAVGMGTPALGVGASAGMAVVVEFVTTFFLMFVVYGTAIDPRGPGLAGLFIGLTVTLGILVAGPVSGGALNPARHLGPALLGGGMENAWVWWVGPLAGASAAALLYHNLLEERRTVLSPPDERAQGKARRRR